LSKKIDEGNGKIKVTNSKSSIIIKKGKNAKLIIEGNLFINSHLSGSSPIRILLSENSMLHIKGDFVIGNGVCISIHKNGRLVIGGRLNESDSGITADSTIMVFSNIEIGFDIICAWGVYITDSNWHSIAGQNHQGNVKIGNHVWIANNSNILKNTQIGDNCIVASNSKVINQRFESDTLIAGVPAKVIKTGVVWKRDI
jgi:acetyltransferase-like isoleucine patch superfamily enzyme